MTRQSSPLDELPSSRSRRRRSQRSINRLSCLAAPPLHTQHHQRPAGDPRLYAGDARRRRQHAAASRHRRIGGAGSAESRCVVPFSSFSENEVLPDGTRPPVWFAFDESRPLAFFAGLWTRWTSVRKVNEGATANDLFAFLTTEPNAEVKAIHPKAMPVILTTPAEVETWLAAPTIDALALQRPLLDGALKIVARGDRTGDSPES
jgi:putative SOS response-associated peptidase YedK